MVRRRGDRGNIYLALAVIAVAAVIVGVGAGTSWYGLRAASSSSGCPTGVTLQGAGASFPAALVTQWVASYHTAEANTVNYQNSGAGQGITDLTEKTVDFALTDEPLTSSESSALVAAVGTVLTLPVTGGAVVLVYNATALGYSGPLNLTGTELAGIYLGMITTWSQLSSNNPGLASSSKGIVPVHRSDPAGMTYVLTNFMSDENTTWRTSTGLGTSIDPSWWTNVTAAYGADGNKAVLTHVAGTAGAIGYTDLYDAKVTKGLSVALIVNSHSTPIYPTVANTASAIADVYAVIGPSLPSPTGNWSSVTWVNAAGATDYPLATLVYLMVPENPGAGHTASATDAAALEQWIGWVATSGQTFNSTQFPYVSPPAPLLTQDVAALSDMNYNGATLPSCT